MDEMKAKTAAAILAAAYRGGERPDRLPADCAPANVEEAHAIQDALIEALAEHATAWKVGPQREGRVLRGAIVASRLLHSPARIDPSRVPLLGVEAEIAFRLDQDLMPRSWDYDKDEISAVVTALVAIEVVDTRFASYENAPFLDRAADFMSNGALVIGTARPDWRTFDLSRLEVIVTLGGKEVVRRVGGHASLDPILPAIALANDMLKAGPVPAGTIMTTGTVSGLLFSKPGDRAKVEFPGFGNAEIIFEA